MAVIPAGFAQANFIYSGPGLPDGAECTLGLQVGSPGPTAAEVAEEVGTLWDASTGAFRTQETTIDGCLVKFGPTLTGPSAFFPMGDAGGGPLGVEAPNVAVLLHKNTLDGGRAGKGRMYWPGFYEEHIGAGGFVDATIAGDFEAALVTFLNGLVAADINAVVLHGPDSPISAPSLITSITVDPRVATQQRRLRRRT